MKALNLPRSFNSAGRSQQPLSLSAAHDCAAAQAPGQDKSHHHIKPPLFQKTLFPAESDTELNTTAVGIFSFFLTLCLQLGRRSGQFSGTPNNNNFLKKSVFK